MVAVVDFCAILENDNDDGACTFCNVVVTDVKLFYVSFFESTKIHKNPHELDNCATLVWYSMQCISSI